MGCFAANAMMRLRCVMVVRFAMIMRPPFEMEPYAPTEVTSKGGVFRHFKAVPPFNTVVAGGRTGAQLMRKTASPE